MISSVARIIVSGWETLKPAECQTVVREEEVVRWSLIIQWMEPGVCGRPGLHVPVIAALGLDCVTHLLHREGAGDVWEITHKSRAVLHTIIHTLEETHALLMECGVNGPPGPLVIRPAMEDEAFEPDFVKIQLQLTEGTNVRGQMYK